MVIGISTKVLLEVLINLCFVFHYVDEGKGNRFINPKNLILTLKVQDGAIFGS